MLNGTTSFLIAARWAYNELRSPRFATTYDLPARHPLRAKSETFVPFEELSDAEIEQLRALLENHSDRRGLYPILTFFDTYRRQEFAAEDLCNVSLAPGLGWTRFEDFAQGRAPPEIGAQLRRILAAETPLSLVPFEPSIIVPCSLNGRPFSLLLEGTFRMLHFARAQTQGQKIDVWIPAGNKVCELSNGPGWL